MTDPFPDRRRERRHGRTDHQRDTPDHQRGPSPRQVQRALSAIEEAGVPGTPSVSMLSIMRDGCDLPCEVGDRVVRRIGIEEGRPDHGALRSDTHVSDYEVTLPFAEVDSDAYAPDECRECGEADGTYIYSAYHFIAGYETLVCHDCGTKLYGEDWG